MKGIWNFDKLENYLMTSKSPSDLAESLKAIRDNLRQKNYHVNTVHEDTLTDLIDLFEGMDVNKEDDEK
jgi:Glu-tRNA(Gln) amidotransferase subunit E-like FAD-binding protein